MNALCAASAAAGLALLAGCAIHNEGCLADPAGHVRERQAQAAVTLDALHRFASEAKFDEYFACYTPDAVFMGTDATERWTLDEFKAYARPHFDAGKGWTYTLIEGRRFISFSPGVRAAWFDEALMNAKLGECRGTGVLMLGDDGLWRIAHYNLTMPVPNGIIESVAERIRTGS
jgi:hypothetical protein